MPEPKPSYLEAYPRLNIFKGKLSRWNGGEVPLPIVRFRVCTRHAGGLIVLSRTKTSLIVDYDFPSLIHCRGRDQAVLNLVARPNGVDPERQYLQCEGCKKGFVALVFDRVWACPKCLKLSYRSQVIGTKVRLAEKLDQLKARLGTHRPKYAHQRRYDEQCARAKALRKRLGQRLSTVAGEYVQIVDAEWLAIGDVDHLPHPRFDLNEGKIVPCASTWETKTPVPSGLQNKPFRMGPPPEIY